MENSNSQLYTNSSNYTPSGNKPVLQSIKDTVVSGIGKAAQSLHQQADKSTTSQFTDLGHQTAGWLEKSADYLQQAEPEKMRADFENQVRKNPAKSLLIAGAAGLALGIIFRGKR